MKKILCVALLFALLAGFTACAKKGKVFVEPPTEIVTDENGETMVYEVVTDESGVAVTEENGETKVIPYDPPVTEKGGYLVTDAQGSTIKQSQTTSPYISVENAAGEIDEMNGTLPGGSTAAGSTTAKNGATTPAGSTAPITNAAGETVSPPNKTTAPANATTAAPTVPQTGIVGETHPITGTLSKAKAAKLLQILDFDNKFDEDLCSGDFYAARNSLVTYIADINLASSSIKADKDLFAFVGAQNLSAWKDNMLEAQDRYNVFMTMVDKEKDAPQKSKLYLSAYTNFQEAYRKSLDAYYCMQLAAEKMA